VTIDGVPLVTQLDGLAVDVDPGPHTFVFDGADGSAEQKVVVAEGAKAQHIAVVFGAAGTAPVVTRTPGTEATPSGPSLAAQNGFSFGLRLGVAFPAGSVYSGESASQDISAMVPIWLDAGYLINPNIYVGAYFQYGVIVPNNCATGVSCSGSDIRIGLEGQYRFLPDGRFDPWAGFGFGYEIANGSDSGFNTNTGAPETVGVSLSGFEFFHVEAGADYKALPNLNIGPLLALSLGEFGNVSGSVNGASESLNEPSALHLWIFVMVRGQYDLHI